MHHESSKIGVLKPAINVFSFTLAPFFFFLSEPQIMILPLSQLIKSETWETSLVLSSSHNLNPGSLFGISPISCKSTGAGPLSVGIFVKHKFACVTLLLKRLQHLPNPCRIKSGMAHKAHMTCPLSSSQTKTVFGGEWDVTPRKLLCPHPPLGAYPTCNSLIPPVVLKMQGAQTSYSPCISGASYSGWSWEVQ